MFKPNVFYKFDEVGNFFTHLVLVDGYYLYMNDKYTNFKLIRIEDEKIKPNEDRYTELPGFYFPKEDKREMFENLFKREQVIGKKQTY